MLLFFTVISYSWLFSFNSASIDVGSHVHRWFEADDGFINPEFRFDSNTQSGVLELLVFKSNYDKTMIENKCCEYGNDNCTLSENMKNESGYFRQILKIEEETETIEAKTSDLSYSQIKLLYPNAHMIYESSIWSIVLSNCGKNDVSVTGTIKVYTPFGFADIRVRSISNSTMLLCLLLTVFISLWLYLFLLKNPHLDIVHYPFVIAASSLVLESIVYAIHFYIWNRLGSNYLITIIFTSLVSALSKSLVCFSVYQSIVGNIEIQYKQFYPFICIFLLSSFGETKGISDLFSRSSGRWLLGYGSIPCFSFLSNVLVIVIMLYYTKNLIHLSPQKRSLHQVVLITIISYCFVIIVMTVFRWNMTLEDAKKFEWLTFCLDPLFFTTILILNGAFWLKYNPIGWQTISDGGVEALGLDNSFDETMFMHQNTANEAPLRSVPIEQPIN